MSEPEELTDHPVTRRAVRFRLLQQLPLLVTLVVLWMLLWGTVSWLSFASGVLVAVAATQFFYLPPVELSGRFNPFWLLVFLAHFGGELFLASFAVAARAFGPPIRSNAIIEVDLRSHSDFVVTLTATAISLVPGSLVIEIDRDRAALFVHVLGARTQRDLDRARRTVLATEARLVRAVGSRDDLERCRAS
jgi:multicomponent Na+:H+ antiporter subunit E